MEGEKERITMIDGKKGRETAREKERKRDREREK